LTTHRSMRSYPSSSGYPVRMHMAYAIGRFFDIPRPPGGCFDSLVVFLDSWPTTGACLLNPKPTQVTENYGDLR